MPLKRQRLEGRSCEPGTPTVVESHQELEEARTDSSLEPLEGARPCCHFDFRLPVSRRRFKAPSLWSFVTAALGH